MVSLFFDTLARAVLWALGAILALQKARNTLNIPGTAEVFRLAVSSQPISSVDERYLCFCIDLGQIAEPTRFWNPDGASGNTFEVRGRPTYDFGRERLRNMAAALSPAYLRIGGTEADRAFYALDEASLSRAADGPPWPYKSVLTAAHVDAIANFARAAGCKIVFALNAGWGARTLAGAWESSQARLFLSFARQHQLPIDVLELGNEPNCWPYLHGGLTVLPEQFARDLLALSVARDDLLPSARIAAPSTAIFPTIGEVPAPNGIQPLWMLSYLEHVLVASERLVQPDIVTWHYYPGQSNRAISLHKYWQAAVAAVVTAFALLLASIRWYQASSPSALSSDHTENSDDGCGSSNSGKGMRMPESFDGKEAAARLACNAVQSGCRVHPRCWLVCVLFVPCALVVIVCIAAHELVTPITLHTLRSVPALNRARVWGMHVRDVAHRSIHSRTGDRTSSMASPVVWLGETGSAQAGGQPGVSGRWVAMIWWLDQLGSLATIDHKVQCRQTLSGSDYGLIDEATLHATPEFWASVLWRRLMGTEVLATSAEGAPESVRTYCHRHPGQREPCCVILNLGDTAVTLDVGNNSQEVWHLRAVALDSRTMTINGVEPSIAPNGMVPELPGVPVPVDGRLVIPPCAAAFVRF